MTRWRAVGASVLIVGVVTGIVLAALLSDGRAGSESTTNDGGAWLLNRSESSIGHVNRVVGEIASTVGPFDGRFDVDQSDHVVVVHDRGAGQAVLIDTNLGQPGAPVRVGDQTEVRAAPDAIVLIDHETSSIWRFTRDEFGTVTDLSRTDPLVQAAGPVTVAVGRDGTIAAVDVVGAAVHRVLPGALPEVIGDPLLAGASVRSVTLVGDAIAIASDETDGSSLIVVRGAAVTRFPVDRRIDQLQQPTIGADDAESGDAVVAIATDGEVLGIDLGTGAVASRGRLDGSQFVPPIVHDGCLWAVSVDPSPVFHFCGRSEPLVGSGTEIRLTLVNGWVWVNDVNQGSIWFVREDELELQQIDDWSAALEPTDEELTSDENAGGEEEIVVNPNADEEGDVDPLDDDGVNVPPVAEDDEVATRRGRTIVARVLDNDLDEDNDPLTVESLTGIDAEGRDAQGAQVSMTPDGGAVQVAPPADFVGEIRFGYVVHDGRQGRDEAAVVVTVNAPDEATNRPPVTVDDNATVRAGRSVSLNVLTNDSDPDGDVLVLTDVAGEAGAVNFTPDGEIAYSPDVTSTEGIIELAYTVADDYGAEATGTARIRVRAADSNQAPEARNDIGHTSVARPVILNVLGNDSDPDGDPLSVQNLQAVDSPVTTAQLAPDGRFLFRPEAPGTYRFTYTVSDGPEIDQAQIRVDVDDATTNRPPVAVVDEVALAVGERRLVRVLDNDGDPDGDVVGIVDWIPADGIEIDEMPGLGFMVRATPTAEPRTTFRYWISDGIAPPVRGDVVVSALAREPVDYPPVAVADTVDVRAGTTAYLPVLLNDHDPEGGALSLAAPLPQLVEGELRLSADRQQLLLRVATTQQFSFRFSYDVEDPAGNRSSAVVNVRIVDPGQPNRAPVAGPDVARTPAGTAVPVPVLANDFDPDGDPVTVEAIAQQPLHGTVEMRSAGLIVYRPNPGFSGTDTFVYTLVDGYQPPLGPDGEPLGDAGPGRSLGEVYVGVMPTESINRPPSAVDDVEFPAIRIGADPVALPVLLNDSDPDADPISVTGVTPPVVGTATVAADGSAVTYTPPADGEPREVSFSYSIADGRDGTDTAKVVLELAAAPPPVPPEAVDDTVGPVRARQQIAFDPRENDLDRDGSRADLVIVPGDPAITVQPDGTVSIVAPTRTSDLSYRVRDVSGLMSEPAFITVLVTANEAPVVAPVTAETKFNTPLTLDLHTAVSDPDADPLVLTLGERRTGGSVTVVGQPADDFLQVTFTPDTDFEGVAGFDFLVDDRMGHTVAGRATITVLPPENRPPVAAPITVAAEAGIASVVRLPDSVTDPDLDGPAKHTFSVSGPNEGAVTLEGPNARGEVVVRSAVTSGGRTDSFTYTVVDGPHTVSNTVTVTLAVPDFPPPTLTDDRASVLQGAATPPIPLLANDVDNSPTGLAGDGLLVTAVGVSANGRVDLQGSSVVFTPNPDFFGTATFSYTVRDGRRSIEGESTGLVTVDVVGKPAQPQPPVIESVGNRYLVLSWSAPAGDAARAPVSGYVLRYTGADGGGGAVTFDTPTTGYRAEGLTNGVRYCFTIAAVNAAGQGEFSASPGTAECGTPDVRPEAPAAPAVTFGNREIAIRWSPPLNQGSPIKNYQVRISGGRQELSAELGVATQFTWSGLNNGTDYTFEVRAQNSSVENGGWSDWSALSAPEHPLTLPDAPAQPQVQRGDRQVRITWAAPYDGGDTITRYQVRSSIAGAWVDVTPQGATNGHTWENIPNGTDVSFQVRAVNRDPRSTNPGNISPPSAVVRTCSVPDAPGQPQATRGDASATVTWSPPGAQGCAISEYRITSSAGTTQTAPAGANRHVFTGLTNGTSYTFTVTAINEVVTVDGRSPSPSPASAAVVPAGPPLVTNVTGATNVGVRQVRVDWSAANANGSPITEYQISVNDGAWSSVGTGTSVTRTEASNGATYSYRVRAVNSVGPSVQTGSQSSVTTWDFPGTPNVTASGGDQRVNGSWNTPANNGTALTGVEAKLTRSDCSAGGPTSNSGTSASFTGLLDSTTYRLCVRYQNAVGWGNYGSAPATTNDPPRSVTAYFGGSAQGQPNCDSQLCKFLNATGTNFTPGQSYNVVCQDNQSGSWVTFSNTYTRVADASGTVRFTDTCYFGYNTFSARVVIGGVGSNALRA